jgi:hypothetical protein
MKSILVAVSLFIAFAVGITYAHAGETQVSIALPAEAKPGCFVESVRIPHELVPHLPDVVDVGFTVTADGSISRVYTQGATQIETQLKLALERCRWVPGANLSGVPTDVAVIMPVRFKLVEHNVQLLAEDVHLAPMVALAH